MQYYMQVVNRHFIPYWLIQISQILVITKPKVGDLDAVTINQLTECGVNDAEINLQNIEGVDVYHNMMDKLDRELLL